MLSTDILAQLDTLSGGRLQRRTDLAMLLDATPGERRALLDDLSFQAKFAVRARTIMERIGRDGEGYDRLSEELGAAVTRMRDLLAGILGGMGEKDRTAFSSRYLEMTPGGLAELFVLCADLGWYKNWLNDRRSPGG
jgi:hypothetical protein